MLDIVEKILTEVAAKLMASHSFVHDVFHGPSVTTVPLYKNEENVQIIEPQTLLTLLYNLGIAKLTDIQVACLLKVIGKPDLRQAILYEELKMILENFGVARPKSGQIKFELDKNDSLIKLPEFKPGVSQPSNNLTNEIEDINLTEDSVSDLSPLTHKHSNIEEAVKEDIVSSSSIIERTTVKLDILRNKQSQLF